MTDIKTSPETGRASQPGNRFLPALLTLGGSLVFGAALLFVVSTGLEDRTMAEEANTRMSQASLQAFEDTASEYTVTEGVGVFDVDTVRDAVESRYITARDGFTGPSGAPLVDDGFTPVVAAECIRETTAGCRMVVVTIEDESAPGLLGTHRLTATGTLRAPSTK